MASVKDSFPHQLESSSFGIIQSNATFGISNSNFSNMVVPTFENFHTKITPAAATYTKSSTDSIVFICASNKFDTNFETSSKSFLPTSNDIKIIPPAEVALYSSSVSNSFSETFESEDLDTVKTSIDSTFHGNSIFMNNASSSEEVLSLLPSDVNSINSYNFHQPLTNSNSNVHPINLNIPSAETKHISIIKDSPTDLNTSSFLHTSYQEQSILKTCHLYSSESKKIKNESNDQNTNSGTLIKIDNESIANSKYVKSSATNTLTFNIAAEKINSPLPLNHAINHELELNDITLVKDKEVTSLESISSMAELREPTLFHPSKTSEQLIHLESENVKMKCAVEKDFDYSPPINITAGRSLLKSNYMKSSLQKNSLQYKTNNTKTFIGTEFHLIAEHLSDDKEEKEIVENSYSDTKNLKITVSNCTNDLNVANSSNIMFTSNTSKTAVANSKDAVVLVPLDMYIRSQQGIGDTKTDYLLSKVKTPVSSCVFLPREHIPDCSARIISTSNSDGVQIDKSTGHANNDYLLSKVIEGDETNKNSNNIDRNRSNYSKTKDGQSLAELLDPLNKYFVGNKCLLCGFISKEKKNSGRRHLASHLKTRNFKCNICGKCFKTPNTLHSHKTLIHEDTKEFVCNDCGQTFSRINNLRNHKMKAHAPPKHICSICSKRFSCFKYMKKHLRVHTGEKPYKCVICDQSFRTSEALKAHSSRHNPERRYVCSVCSKSYSRKLFLVEHMNTHQGSPYKCHECGKSFNFKSNLIQHNLVHSDTRKHSCETCGMKFKLPHHLKSHILTHESK